MTRSNPGFLALLGDSILDNARYTHPEPDAAGHLRALLGGAWVVELAARDGATMDLLPPQLEELPGRPDGTVLSIGGNDAIGHLDILAPRATSSTEMLTLLQNIADDFEEGNDRIIRTATRFGVEVLELRSVGTEVSDVGLEIEPSAEGARKIAAEIAAVVLSSPSPPPAPAWQTSRHSQSP